MNYNVDPIEMHEGERLADAAAYYLQRNAEARGLLAQSGGFPSIEDSSGSPVMHYETMVIGAVECAPGTHVDDRRVLLHPALPINGARPSDEMASVLVTLMIGTEVRIGYVALLQRMNDSSRIGTVYFFSDDRAPAYRPAV